MNPTRTSWTVEWRQDAPERFSVSAERSAATLFKQQEQCQPCEAGACSCRVAGGCGGRVRGRRGVDAIAVARTLRCGAGFFSVDTGRTTRCVACPMAPPAPRPSALRPRRAATARSVRRSCRCRGRGERGAQGATRTARDWTSACRASAARSTTTWAPPRAPPARPVRAPDRPRLSMTGGGGQARTDSRTRVGRRACNASPVRPTTSRARTCARCARPAPPRRTRARSRARPVSPATPR